MAHGPATWYNPACQPGLSEASSVCRLVFASRIFKPVAQRR
jgi:hypothetical protein